MIEYDLCTGLRVPEKPPVNTLWTGVKQLSEHIKIVDTENGGRVVVISGEEQKVDDYKEIIVKEYRNEKGLITRREIGEEIVRCRDCIRYPGCSFFGYNFDDYCSRGKRKEQEHE